MTYQSALLNILSILNLEVRQKNVLKTWINFHSKFFVKNIQATIRKAWFSRKSYVNALFRSNSEYFNVRMVEI